MRMDINRLKDMKRDNEPIVMLTAYDYCTARIVDQAGIPLILVGDSLGMVVLGYDSTIPVTMDEMIHHTKAVCRGVKNALLVGDMPFMTYQISVEDTLYNATRFLQEGGAQAVKLEGGVTVADKVEKLVGCGIPVMGHIGLTPQSVNQLGGYKAQGKTTDTALNLVKDAKALEQAGAFAIVLETIPSQLADIITKSVSIPTIGIGAGAQCDGQVQVISDMLGLFSDFVPRHTKQYAKLSDSIKEAVESYKIEVKELSFPTESNCSQMNGEILAELRSILGIKN